MTDSTKKTAALSASQRKRIDALLDAALAESFPASDSISISSGVKAIKEGDDKPKEDNPPKD